MNITKSAAVIIAVLALLMWSNHTRAEEVCKFTYMGLPELINNKALDLPGDAVAMGSHVRVGNSSFLSMEGKPSSVMMIIDNSSSNWDTDPNCNRYKVMTAFLDSVYAKSPRTSVGLAVFGTTLWFDPADDNVFQPLGSGSKGGYIPLLVLDSIYTGTNNNVGYPKKGIDILKFYLQFKTIPPELLYSSWNFNGRGTNINIGFDAAKDAMLKSPSPKDRHFCMFLSDGEATEPANGNMFLYVNGTDVPTTFTVYYTPDDSVQAFENLEKMTENIKNNGYSSTNPISNLWSIKTDYNTLMKLLMENVIKEIITSQTTFVPTDLSVNTTVSVSGWDSTGFEFGKLFPLIGWETDFKYNIKYKITKDSIVGTDTFTVIVKDTTTEVNFTANIDPTLPVSDSVELSHWGRSLGFYHNNAEISAADNTMDSIEIRFTKYKVDTLYGYEDVSIIVTNGSGGAQDQEVFQLKDNGGYFSSTFPRVCDNPVQGNGILEHEKIDTIIAIFRNPELPLDTLRKAIPLMIGSVTFTCGYYHDKNADGYVDSIFVETTTDIPGGMTDGHLQEIVDKALQLPAFRDFTITGRGLTTGGFFLRVTESTAHTPVTYVTDEDKLITVQTVLSGGAEVKAGTWPVYDRVAPIIHWAPRSALLRDYRVSSRYDTLGVKFSEPVKSVSSDEPFYFLNHTNNAGYIVKLSAAGQPNPDSLVFHVVSVEGTMQDGDSLWIHETDRVSDTAGNFQNNTANTKRRLYVDVLYGPVTIACGYYYDNNADGYVDSIYVKATTEIEGGLTDAHVQELVQKAITLPAFRDFTVTGSGVVSGGFFVKVTENKGHNPYTYITADDKLIVSTCNLSMGGEVVGATVTIFDRVAPIIHWERKAAYLVDYMVDTTLDILTVKFSEPVNRITSDEPFYFLDMDNNTEYIVKLSDVNHPESDKMVFYITSLSGVDYMEEGDSLWIHETDRVSDIEGNFQNNNKNTRRKLFIRKVVMPYSFIPKAVTPIDLKDMNNYIIPDEIISVLQSQGVLDKLDLQQNSSGSYHGMLIMVVPDPENIGKYLFDLELEGKLGVYDAVGNQVIAGKEMAWWDEKKSLVYVWNMRNDNGRIVGPGVYISLIEWEDVTESLGYQNGGPKAIKKLSLGVRE